MKEAIKIPSVGESVSEVTIAEFLKSAHSYVKEGEEIVELETEKVNQVLYAPISGTIEWTVKKGDNVPIGTIIGYVDSEKQAPVENIVNKPPEKKAEITKEKIPEPKLEKKEEAPLKEEKLRFGKDEFLSELTSSAQMPLPSKKQPETSSREEKSDRETRKRMTKIRQTIGSRLVDSLRHSAMLTTFNEADMSAILDLRAKYKDSFQKKQGVKLGFMSFFVKAIVEALKAFPDFNSYLDKDEVVERHYYDIGIAVGTERGLVVPVLRDCDVLSFAEIEKRIENYALRAREGKLAIDDLQGGGFTITNGGVYGSLLSTPILNPPQVGILGMHKIMKRPVVIEDQIVIRPMMYLALSYDHRLIDGKGAVTFLVLVKEILEDPTRLILFEQD